MAKKKVSKQHQTVTLPIMDDSSVQQIQNLKNLNAVLLKETAQRRQQIESLQSASDALHMENAVVSVFVENQVKGMNLHFDTLLGEREHEVAALERQLSNLAARLRNETNAFTRERDELVHEALRLEERLNRERKLREQAEKLKSEGEEVNSEKEKVIAELKTDRDLALASSQNSLAVIQTLKDEIDVLTREKNEVETLNNVQEQKIVSLEVEVEKQNESLKSGEEFMRAKVLELEQNLGLALQTVEEMENDSIALLREKKEMEKSVDLLTEQKDSVQKVLDAVRMALKDKQHELDEAIRLSDEIHQVKVNCESEIVALLAEVDRLKESCGKVEEENRELVSQVKGYRNAVDEAVLEKESMRKVIDGEKKEVEKLQLLVAGTQEVVVKSDAELGRVRSERDELAEKKTMLEVHVDVLRKEIDALQSMLVEARKENEDLSAKVEVWCSNSNKALAMLKSTAAALVCEHRDRGVEVVSDDEKLLEEVQPYAQELDAIKKAFKSKDEMVDGMKQKLVSLNKSVVEAHKSKSLWTMISSATTIFAAALAAYVARGR